MKLDINLVWQQASAAVAANREVLLALAGVFILLPRLAFELFAPPAPATNTGMDLDAMAQVMQGYYISVAPWLLAVTLVETVGTLAKPSGAVRYVLPPTCWPNLCSYWPLGWWVAWCWVWQP